MFGKVWGVLFKAGILRYYILDDQPKDIEKVEVNDTEDEKNSKYILNGYKRDHFQRNHIIEGIKDAKENDIIIISDIDEIPKLKNINFETFKNKLIFFKQKMCYYKFNLFHKNYDWVGSRACLKKNFKSSAFFLVLLVTVIDNAFIL